LIEVGQVFQESVSMSEPDERGMDEESVERILAGEMAGLAVGGGRISPRIPTVRFESVVEVLADPGAAATRFSEAIARLGRLLDGQPDEPGLTVIGVVGGGFLNLNPAVIQITITPMAEGRSRATLSGTANEGMIKQRAGEKAVRRVLESRELAGLCRPAT
jgi:hypothetical protein